jgi:hypothetical protein
LINFGPIPIGAVLPVFFTTYGKTNGESITLTGLAVTDIEIYKGTSITQRSSDAGYALIDTDGIDVDGITGVHAFSIDTGDNTDAGFYTSGSFYTVVVSAVTVDSQTVNFIAATFRCVTAEGVAGQPKVDTAAFGGSAGTFSSGRPEVNTTHAAGTAWGSGAITAASIAADAITAAKVADGTIDAATFAANAITSTVIANDAITDAKVAADVTIASVTGAVGSVTGAVGSVTGAVGSVAAGGITAASFAANAITAAKLDPDVTTELQSGLATAAALATVDGIVDDILLDTAEIGAAGAGLTALATQASVNTVDDFLDTEVAAILAAVDTEVAAVKTKTDSLTFTQAGHVDANVQRINDVTVIGDGSATPWGP